MTTPRIRLDLHPSFRHDPDKTIIDKLVADVKAQAPLIKTGDLGGGIVGMQIQIPDMHSFVKTFKGRDLFIMVMAWEGDIILHIRELKKYADIPWGFCEESDFPVDMLERLKLTKQ